jgi:hypothetical protein
VLRWLRVIALSLKGIETEFRNVSMGCFLQAFCAMFSAHPLPPDAPVDSFTVIF